MGKSLQMHVVAEGVETREQLEFLREHGCPEAQGFYFSHPVVAGEFSQLLGRNLVEPQSLQIY
jgi:EAL domain-containing protein (putative c-di-GMP-specific phosphodiesterase class I)